MPYLPFIVEAALFTVPVLIYFLLNHHFTKSHPTKTALSVVLFAFLFGLYCFPKESPGYGHVFFLLFSFGTKLFLLPVHWFAWLSIAVKKISIAQRALPLSTVCMLLMVHGIAQESPVVLFAAAMFVLLSYFLCSPQTTPGQGQAPADDAQ